MSKHKIGWLNRPGTTGETWNPVIGCSKASDGCKNCYAERMAIRQCYMGSEAYQDVVKSHFTGNAETGHDIEWHYDGWNGKTAFVESQLEKPLRWRKPRTVFVCSMGDLFHETVPFEWVDKVFAVMALCPQHTFIVLTKRPERMAEYLNEWFPQWDSAMDDFPNEADIDVGGYLEVGADYCGEYSTQVKVWPLPNVWLGTTCENQETAEERIPYLLKCPAAIRFLSCEPLLGEIDLGMYAPSTDQFCDCGMHDGRIGKSCSECGERVHWVICGGEAGPGARPMHPEWARSLRDQCNAAGVPFYFKQWGEWAPGDHLRGYNMSLPDTQYHRWDGWLGSFKLGKKAAGRMLAGKLHDEFPEVTA